MKEQMREYISKKLNDLEEYQNHFMPLAVKVSVNDRIELLKQILEYLDTFDSK